MDLLFYRTFGLDYLVIRPDEWHAKHETDFWLRDFEVLDLWHATLALKEMARQDRSFLRELGREALPFFSEGLFAPGSYEEAQAHQNTVEELLRELGSVFSEHGKPPHFARIYVCRRKPPLVVPRPLPDVWQDVREAIASAERAPRGYLNLEVVSEAGAPVPGFRLEILLSDGELITRATDAQGALRVEPIPQGQCHIRVPGLDGSAWFPAEGASATPVDKGHKQLYVVKKGDNLTRIAKQCGIKGWKKLWDAPENEALRKKRKSPHVLMPGDEVVIPGIVVHEIARGTNQTHRIVVAEAEVQVRLRLQDLAREPFVGVLYDYQYTLGDKTVKKPCSAATDAGGWLQETIPCGVDTLVVTLRKPRLQFALQVNALVPAQDEAEKPITAGVQMRLSSLGYAPGNLTEELSSRARLAVAAFQADEFSDADPTGDLDAETLRALERAYGV